MQLHDEKEQRPVYLATAVLGLHTRRCVLCWVQHLAVFELSIAQSVRAVHGRLSQTPDLPTVSITLRCDKLTCVLSPPLYALLRSPPPAPYCGKAKTQHHGNG